MEDLSYVAQDAPVEYPIELGKTLLSLVFLGLGFLVTTFSLALTHEVRGLSSSFKSALSL